MKKEKVERFAVPETMPERFMGIVYSMVDAFGVDRIPDIMHHVELLGQAVERHVSESMCIAAPDRTNMERRRFITIFKSRYLHHSDMEYSRKVTEVDGKLMGRTIEYMNEKGFDTDEFLEWVFDVFLEENPKFEPATIQFVCSAFVVERFLFENKDKLKNRKEEAIIRADAEKVVERARVQIRVMRDARDEDGLKKIVELLKKYRNGGIMLQELRKNIDEIEQKNNSKEAENGGSKA